MRIHTRSRRLGASGVLLFCGLVVALFQSPAVGQQVNTGYFGGIALMGYDPVAYFTQSKAVKGKPDFTHEWLGETWQFANEKHREAFASNPVAYAPQYGGYCAGEMLFAEVTTGITTNIDPAAWRIVDGKLYIFYDKGYAEVFEENAKKNIEKADSNWAKVEASLKAQ